MINTAPLVLLTSILSLMTAEKKNIIINDDFVSDQYKSKG